VDMSRRDVASVGLRSCARSARRKSTRNCVPQLRARGRLGLNTRARARTLDVRRPLPAWRSAFCPPAALQPAMQLYTLAVHMHSRRLLWRMPRCTGRVHGA